MPLLWFAPCPNITYRVHNTYIYMYARVRARQRKLKICLHSALYNYNTLIISRLSVYTLSTRRLHYVHSAKIVWARFKHPHQAEATLKKMRKNANGR